MTQLALKNFSRWLEIGPDRGYGGSLLFLFCATTEGFMLVLERRLGEQIMIGNNVCVGVTHISGSNVKIGVEAPKEYPIQRGSNRPPATGKHQLSRQGSLRATQGKRAPGKLRS